MRRDYFTVDVATADETASPAIRIEYDGPSDTLTQRLTDPSGELLDGDDIDVTYRLKGDGEDEPGGVLSISNRLTGEFVLEANVPAEGILDALATAGESDDEVGYTLTVTDTDGLSLTCEKQTLLVYDADGSLRRQESLIPGGVEL